MPIHTYTGWNVRNSAEDEQIEPYKKYIFICEGIYTETFYFEKLIDLRKELGIHPLIDIRLWEKTEKDKDKSYPKDLANFAEEQKYVCENEFDPEHDKIIVVFDGDIYERKVSGYETLIANIERSGNIAAVSNPNFEMFLLLHIRDSYEKYIKNHEDDFMTPDEHGSYRKAYDVLRKNTNMNSKRNARIGELAKDIWVAIEQERYINQDVYAVKGKVSSNIGKIIEAIMNDRIVI